MDADTNLVVKWDDKFKACMRQRSKFEQQWHLNMAFYFGRQYVMLSSRAVNDAGYVLVDAPVGDSWRVRAVRNKIKRTIRNEMTKLTKEEPQGYVVPESTDDEDRLAAVAAEALAEYHVSSSNFKRKRFLATFWATICGTGFLKTYYDPVATTEDGVPGRVSYDGVSPFHLLVPYLQQVDIEEQPYVFHCRTIDASLVSHFYDKDIKPNTEPSSSVLDQRFFTSLGINNTKEDQIRQVYVKEVWVKPCREYPQGAMFMYADSTLLYMNETPAFSEAALKEATPDQPTLPTMEAPGLPETSENIYPYEHGKFPFQKIDHIPTGMFYAESTIKDLIPVQKDYNRVRSQIIEHRNVATRPGWAVKKGAVDLKAFKPNQPGIVVQVNPGFDEPTPLKHPELPSQIGVEIDLNNREFDDISGQFEISKGRTPPGVEAASAIAFLQEENDTILYHTVASLEAAVQESMRQTLELIQQNWDTERIVRTVSRNNTLETTLFKSGEFKPGIDYRVIPDSMAPRSRAAKQAVIADMLKQGLIEPRDGLRFMQMAETNQLFKELNVDYLQVERENVIMAKTGQPLLRQDGEQQAPMDEMNPETSMQVPQPTYKMTIATDPTTGMEMTDPSTGQPQMKYQTINEFDNHDVHIQEHSRYMKTQQYEALPWQTKQIFIDHLTEHKEEVAAEQQLAMMQQPMDMEQQQPQELGQP